MRMADISLPPPAPFLALPDEPPIPWTRWLQSFETYLIALELTDVSAARKKALLQHCLGVQGQRVLGTLGNSTDISYDTAVGLLNTHFAAPQSALLWRFLLQQRHQLPGESVHQYVANLRGLASSCKFGALQDQMIRDQLIERTNNAKVRETLLLESDDLLLSRAINTALQVESAAECAATLAKQQAATSSQAVSSDFSLYSRLPLGMRWNPTPRLSCKWRKSSVFGHAHSSPAVTVDLGLALQEPRTVRPVARLAVAAPLRPIPLALRDGVSAELQQLLEAGIIEPVDASPWVSNLVVAKKKTGALRVCVDLRAVNKAVIPDKYLWNKIQVHSSTGSETCSGMALQTILLALTVLWAAAQTPPCRILGRAVKPSFDHDGDINIGGIFGLHNIPSEISRRFDTKPESLTCLRHGSDER
ncbi:hypothetical protein SKAU_G00078070 [Synaphobranchus kaupii]|uniref:Uncharacterized protein n=1 Tax=Synaphobranchus kaupii TaxID=118154 RepID=A0A9Q1FTZ3_SYNKA|nr:hypothetical protein SKAU_G00078070 [Synaphobranchus kaupii]